MRIGRTQCRSGSVCVCKPRSHYGPDIDGYEYGLESGRTMITGSRYTSPYQEEIQLVYDDLETCNHEDLLFSHRVNNTHNLPNRKTVIQHIYDKHFHSVKQVEEYIAAWNRLKKKVEQRDFLNVQGRLREQLSSATMWRDVVNTYFHRKMQEKKNNNQDHTDF
jgi:alpha-glucuronidase